MGTGGNDEKWLITAQESIDDHANHLYCRQAPCTMWLSRSMYSYNKNGLLTSVEPIRRAVQKVLPSSLWAWLMDQWNYLTMTEHPGEWHTFKTIRLEYSWPHMENDLYATVRAGLECVQNTLSEKWRRPLHLFPTRGSLKFFPLYILGPLLKTSNGNQRQIVLVTTDDYPNAAEP